MTSDIRVTIPLGAAGRPDLQALIERAGRRHSAAIGETYIEDLFERGRKAPHQSGYPHITAEEWAEYNRATAEWHARRRLRTAGSNAMSADEWLPGLEPPPIPPETSCCADCGIDTIHTINEWYMVYDDLWDLAWADRRKSRKYWDDRPHPVYFRDEILCIGCLEKRLGRTLIAGDFTNAPVNNSQYKSERMRDRLTAGHSWVVGDPLDSRRVLPSTQEGQQ